MKIAVNTRVLLKGRMEGVCRYIFETTRRMVENHPEDQFFFFFDRPFDPEFVFAENVTPVQIFPPARHPFLWFWWFEISVPKYLKKLDVDVFLSGDTYMSLKTDVPTLLVSHDIAYAHFPDHIPFLNRKYYQYFFPKFHRKASHIVAVSEFTKQDLVSQYQLSPNKISVGHNATPEGFTPISLEEKAEVIKGQNNGKPYFIYIGSLHPRKNVTNLIRAFDLFKRETNSPLQLMIVGRMAWNNSELKNIHAELSFKHDIVFKGPLFEGVPELVAASEALLYVSTFEGFGIPILEGMASGVPVVTSNVSSMPEVAGDAAILVDPFNVHSIADGLKQAVENDAYRNILIKKGQERIKSFNWQTTSDVIYNCLKEIAKK